MRLSKPNFPFKILILFFITIVLNGCSETTFLVNSAKRIGSWGDDPVYKIGNPYKIYGKWYYPAVDYNYKEIGIASWYGPGFHGKKTANGEIFNQNKISAAHRTLPMPSIVKVTNLDNGLVLEKVRVNDRGPFAGNRIIDLSKKAAEELGFVNIGTARVQVEILEEESRKHAVDINTKIPMKVESAEIKTIKKSDLGKLPNESDVNNLDNGATRLTKKNGLVENPIFKDKPIAIQVGAFTDHRNAKNLTVKLSDYKAYIERTFINNKYLYRVRIGPISDFQLAQKIKQKLFDLGYTASHLILN